MELFAEQHVLALFAEWWITPLPAWAFFYQQVVETVRYSPNSAVGKYKSVAHFVKHKTICETKVKAREMHNIVFNNNICSSKYHPLRFIASHYFCEYKHLRLRYISNFEWICLGLNVLTFQLPDPFKWDNEAWLSLCPRRTYIDIFCVARQYVIWKI